MKIKKVDKSAKNWLQKWKMYIFIIVAIGIIFGVSILMTALSFLGVNIPGVMIWAILSAILGVLILIFSLIIIGYLLLMVKR